MEGSYFTGIDFGIVFDRTWYTWTLYWRSIAILKSRQRYGKDKTRAQDTERRTTTGGTRDDDAEAINFGRGVAVRI